MFSSCSLASCVNLGSCYSCPCRVPRCVRLAFEGPAWWTSPGSPSLPCSGALAGVCGAWFVERGLGCRSWRVRRAAWRVADGQGAPPHPGPPFLVPSPFTHLTLPCSSPLYTLNTW